MNNNQPGCIFKQRIETPHINIPYFTITIFTHIFGQEERSRITLLTGNEFCNLFYFRRIDKGTLHTYRISTLQEEHISLTNQASVCPYIPERLEAGTIGYQELAERCLRMAGHQKLWKRASSLSKGNTLPLALEPAHRHRLSEWPEAGTASICPQKLAAVYLLSSRIGLWRRVLPHISHGRIDFSSVSLRGIDPRDYPVYRAAKGLYCGKLLITSAELADEEQVSSEAFGDILNAMLIARYGKTIIAAEVKK